jgi:DNA-binding NtrC family response regulator
MARRILILDTPDGRLQPLCAAFEAATDEQCEVERVFVGDRLLARLHAGLPWDLVIVDCLLGDGQRTGLDLLPAVRQAGQDLVIIAVAEGGDVDLAARAIAAGANDFLVRSGSLERRVQTLLEKVRAHLALIQHNRMLSEQNMLLRQAAWERFQIVGASPQIMEVVRRIERVARIPRPVLIVGERGTGKELVARAIHAAGGDGHRPMIVVNCAAFPDTLLESELFGHEKGAFTGADGLAHGKFELASGGTLFLDEIGHMSLPFQQKILRVVEYGTFTRVGGAEEVRVAARIIAASNTDLQHRMEEGSFLRDLYDRLSFEVIQVPPLRERTGDVELLARHFFSQFMQEIPALRGKRLSPSAIDVLKGYSFPGNVRELKNIVERAVYRDTSNEVTPEDIGMLPSPPAAGPGKPGEPPAAVAGGGFYRQVESYKRQLIQIALHAAAGNQAKAARDIGLSYHQFRYYLRKYGTEEAGQVK